ncbi:hypothetical protein EYB45_08215 [Erythrobacteraceae bacterium CFH 75059]|uniref:hypothetical protein n=1 Tax=Qipengyuania thermophila TaxID=2509361 RepID=UPI001021C463|nr:hypothetical protein [Qipengyuania thermophila]TCD05442.1 hypothetical protein EYB45_08215 [Erythrobacteraceae bacterium CFH 75059]
MTGEADTAGQARTRPVRAAYGGSMLRGGCLTAALSTHSLPLSLPGNDGAGAQTARMLEQSLSGAAGGVALFIQALPSRGVAGRPRFAARLHWLGAGGSASPAGLHAAAQSAGLLPLLHQRLAQEAASAAARLGLDLVPDAGGGDGAEGAALLLPMRDEDEARLSQRLPAAAASCRCPTGRGSPASGAVGPAGSGPANQARGPCLPVSLFGREPGRG